MNEITQLIQLALNEDVGAGDHSSLSCVPANSREKAILLVKENGIIAGLDIAKQVLHLVDPSITTSFFKKDGDKVQKGEIAFEAEGSAQSLLKAERLLLNYMQRMSGIATKTNKMISLIGTHSTKILDTRKTTPGFRIFEKMAVKIGGGTNHRFGLFDMIMIKDNHIDYAGGIQKAIKKANDYIKEKQLDLKIEIEARNLEELDEILAAEKVDRIMLDNFSYSDLRKAVQLINGRSETEASGGITEETIAEYAACGVDFISVGALTHQIQSLDLSFKAVKHD